jgi:hypothetical protein
MTIGNNSIFAIESYVKQAYERLSFRALGFFVIYVGGCCYGVRKPDATFLACSFTEVANRISRRGQHIAPFINERNAGKIVEAVRGAKYAQHNEHATFFGIPEPEFLDIINLNQLEWAPDGDSAFDDGSSILHFDVDNRVRLIAFKVASSGSNGYYVPGSLKDQWLDADEFYSILQRWRDAFEAEWTAMPKISQNVT